MTLEKGAMIFHMLRWEVGDKAFLDILKGAQGQYTDSSMRTQDFVKVAEAQSQQQLTAFFAQWVDGTGGRSSPTNTPFTGWEITRASEPLARSTRTWIFSACRWSCA